MTIQQSFFSQANSKLLMDPIHGGIEVSEYEMAVINHQLFQRLKFVYQNDVLFFVFPGATHNRFQHSIGVMHIAGKFFNAMIAQSLKMDVEVRKKKKERISRKLEKHFADDNLTPELLRPHVRLLMQEEFGIKELSRKEVSKIFGRTANLDKVKINVAKNIEAKIEELNTRYAKNEKQVQESLKYFLGCVRLAALLHDTGHFPFSHLFEKSSVGKAVLSNQEVFESWGGSWNTYYLVKDDEPLEHEHYSIRCAKAILDDVNIKTKALIEINDVISIMAKSERRVTEKFIDYADSLQLIFGTRMKREEMAEKVLEFLRAIISSDLDADKMDYLLRDSFYSGSKYGVYNLDHLLDNVAVGFDISTNWLGIAVLSKGIGALEDFAYSRFQCYQYIYNHKSVVGFRDLFKKALEEIYKVDIYREKILKYIKNPKAFEDFTDTFFWEIFREYARENPSSITAQLLKRKKPIFIYSKKQKLEDFDELRIQEYIVRKGRNLDDVDFVYDKISFAERGSSKIRILHKDTLVEESPKKLEYVDEHSDFFDKFDKVKLTFVFEKLKI